MNNYMTQLKVSRMIWPLSNSISKRFGNNRGFTLAEMVITVAVMAILIGISTPSIFEFMRQRDNQSEEIAEQEIRKALQAYMAAKGSLPADNGTGVNAWSTLLAGYSRLSANEIANDVWNRPRSYLMYQTTRTLFGTDLKIYYATVHSMGLNGTAENTYIDNTGATVTIPGIAVTTSNGKTTFSGSSVGTWWKNVGSTDDERITSFSALRPGGDDGMMRFTNYSEMLNRYNTTVQRLDRITQSLEAYTRSGYANRVAFCNTAAKTAALCDNGVPETTIYYPRSSPQSSDTDTAVYGNSNIFVHNALGTDAARRTDMQGLMNELGLPIEFCCSAHVNSSDGKPAPFYYFSNPRPRASGGGCGTRPGPNDGKLPARTTTQTDSDGACG